LRASVSRALEQLPQGAGRSFAAENVQKIVQLKDAADLIVIDTLMNQQDRFGDIHYLATYYYVAAADLDSDGSPKLKSIKNLTPDRLGHKARRRTCPLYVAGLVGPGEQKHSTDGGALCGGRIRSAAPFHLRFATSVEEGFIAELGFGSADVIQHET
jgi:hypothetical protein